MNELKVLGLDAFEASPNLPILPHQGHCLKLQTAQISAHYQAVLAYCKRYLKDDTNAQEACQEAMLNAFNHQHMFAHRCSLQTWLFKIAFNACTNFYHKNHKYQARLLEYMDDSVDYNHHDGSVGLGPIFRSIDTDEAEYERNELQQKLALATKQLSQTQQDILYYRFVEELSLSGVAQTLGIKESKVKMNYYRALKKLNRLYTH